MKDVVELVHDPQGKDATPYVQSMAFFRATRLADIARAQAAADEKTGSKATFEQALSEARRMPDPPSGKDDGAYSKSLAFYAIAGAQARAGFLKEAYQTADAIRMITGGSPQPGGVRGFSQVAALIEIAQVQGAAAETHEALTWINTLKEPATKAYALLGLAKGLLERAGAEPPEEER